MFMAGSWAPADVGLMIVFGAAATAMTAIGFHVVRSAMIDRREAGPRPR